MPVIFLVAGETSGDFLGAQLMKALKARFFDHIQFKGVGGSLMEQEGLISLFPIQDLSFIGIIEVFPHLLALKKRFDQTLKAVEGSDLVITIDSPGFNFRLGKKIKERYGDNIPLVHYVAPSVWAWKPKRAKKIASFLDHILCLLPYEPPFFEKEGLKATFVGHPLLEIDLTKYDEIAFRRRYNIPEKAMVLLPGSREGEIKRLLPIFKKTVELIRSPFVIIPTLPHLKDLITSYIRNFHVPYLIIDQVDEKWCAFKLAERALAASGTVSLELAYAQVPMVITYKINFLTYRFVKRLIKVNYVNLINILLDKKVIPELLQKECTPYLLSQTLLTLNKEEQKKAFQQSLSKLKIDDIPSFKAANVLIDSLEEKKHIST